MTQIDTDNLSPLKQPKDPAYQEYLRIREQDIIEAGVKIETIVNRLVGQIGPDLRATIEGFCLGAFEQGYEAARINHQQSRFLGKRRKKRRG